MIAPVILVGIAAVLTLAAASLAVLRRQRAVSAALALASLFGVLVVLALLFGPGWDTGFAGAIWVSIGVTLVLFIALSAREDTARPLAALLMPYLAVLGVLALLFPASGAEKLSQDIPKGWIWAHIAFSVVTYGLLTLTAVAGLSAMIQERALKTKTGGRFSSVLPNLAPSEKLETKLLRTSLIVLSIGIATGMSVQFFESGSVIDFDHKTIFALLAFAVVAGLAAARHFIGLRGRRGARIAMAAWLLLTLAYPGVKLATGLIGG